MLEVGHGEHPLYEVLAVFEGRDVCQGGRICAHGLCKSMRESGEEEDGCDEQHRVGEVEERANSSEMWRDTI